MTVEQLIKYLQTQDPSAEVFAYYGFRKMSIRDVYDAILELKLN